MFNRTPPITFQMYRVLPPPKIPHCWARQRVALGQRGQSTPRAPRGREQAAKTPPGQRRAGGTVCELRLQVPRGWFVVPTDFTSKPQIQRQNYYRVSRW